MDKNQNRNFRISIKPWVLIVCLSAAALCISALVGSILSFVNSTLSADRFTAASLGLFNFLVAVTAGAYLLRSGYSLKKRHVNIRTAYFNDRIEYENIAKILYYVSEEELYLQLKDSDDSLIKINIAPQQINGFVKLLKAEMPDTPYEISLKMEIEE